MASLNRRAVERAIMRKLHFVRSNTDHRRLELWCNGKVVARTKTSHGADASLSDRLVAMMARQLHISSRQLQQTVQCPFSFTDYLAVLVAKKQMMPGQCNEHLPN